MDGGRRAATAVLLSTNRDGLRRLPAERSADENPMDETLSNRVHECPARATKQCLCARHASLLATFAFLSCLPACSGDSVSIPSTPTAYRLTFTSTDERNPLRTISATIDWPNNLFIAGMNG